MSLSTRVVLASLGAHMQYTTMVMSRMSAHPTPPLNMMYYAPPMGSLSRGYGTCIYHVAEIQQSTASSFEQDGHHMSTSVYTLDVIINYSTLQFLTTSKLPHATVQVLFTALERRVADSA